MNTHDKPLAAPGLTSYRYRGAYGWVMIGAKDTCDALREAARSMTYHGIAIENLEMWNGECYVRLD